jgi:hypothetical protein
MTKKTVNPVNRNKRMKHVDYDNESDEYQSDGGQQASDKNNGNIKNRQNSNDASEEPVSTNKKVKIPSNKKDTKSSGGFNYAAIAILLMFAIPMVIGGFMHVRFPLLSTNTSCYPFSLGDGLSLSSIKNGA